MRLVKWELKVGKETDLGLEEETLRKRSGPEVEDWRARMKGNVRAEWGRGPEKEGCSAR